MQGRGWSDGDNTAMATETSPLTPFCHDSDDGDNDGDAGEGMVAGGMAGKDVAVDRTAPAMQRQRGRDGDGGKEEGAVTDGTAAGDVAGNVHGDAEVGKIADGTAAGDVAVDRMAWRRNGNGNATATAAKGRGRSQTGQRQG